MTGSRRVKFPAHEFRRSPGEYLRQRVEYACGRLRSSDTQIAEIAQEAGFFDHSHLSRVFAKEMGISPSAFRKITIICRDFNLPARSRWFTSFPCLQALLLYSNTSKC